MRNGKARQVAQMGVLFALAIALSLLESMLSPLLGLMPAMKIGLANIVVMYALLFLGRRQALALVVLKAAFALMTRGAAAGFLSLCGGAGSLLILCLLLLFSKVTTGIIFSVTGAITHNLCQLLGARLLLGSAAVLAYAPVLLISGLIVGSITWKLMETLIPYLSRITPTERGADAKEAFSKFKK